MLRRFEVEGFRNFGQRLVLDLTRLHDYQFNTDATRDGLVKCGIVYGRNAVGKTNLCNALFDVKANVGAPERLTDETNYLCADILTESARFLYSFAISGHVVDYAYSKRSRDRLLDESLSVDGRLVFSFDHGEHKLTDGDLSLANAQHLNWSFRDPGMSVLRYVCNNVPADPVSPVLQTYRFISNMHPIADSYTLNRRFVSKIAEMVVEGGLVHELESFLSRFGITEHLAVHETPSGDPVLYFEKGQRPVPFAENCSSGTVALLRLFRYFETVEGPSFLFVDEFDAFYHYALAEEVIRYFKESGSHQVLCASHNTDLFSNKVLRPDCLFILSRDGVTSAADATRRELREGNNLEKLYKAGEFGV